MKNIKVCRRVRWFYFSIFLLAYLILVPIMYQTMGYDSETTISVASIGVFTILFYLFTYGKVKIHVDEKTLECRPFHPCRLFKIDKSRIENVNIVQKRLGDAVIITYGGGNKLTLFPDNSNELIELLKKDPQ